MRLNMKVRYGIACLYELSSHAGEYVGAERIAAAQDIPPAYAHKVLQSLAHAGLVMAVKGAGYRLTRPLEDITALSVIEALTAEASHEAPMSGVCAALERKMDRALEGITIADVPNA